MRLAPDGNVGYRWWTVGKGRESTYRWWKFGPLSLCWDGGLRRVEAFAFGRLLFVTPTLT